MTRPGKKAKGSENKQQKKAENSAGTVFFRQSQTEPLTLLHQPVPLYSPVPALVGATKYSLASTSRLFPPT